MNMCFPISRGWLLIFLTLALATPGLAQTNAPATNSVSGEAPPTGGLVTLRDVVIGKGGTQDLHADITYRQNATQPMPAVIWIHGGGWISGTYHDGPIIPLARAGYFAASIEYRLSNVAKWPAQIQDCKLAVRWLRANAAKYNVDPNRIGVWGASAGGHLVACLGTMGDVKEYEGDGGYPGTSSAVQAVVDYFGPTDFTNPDIFSTTGAKGAVTGLFEVPYAQNPDLWKSACPLFYVKVGDPPMFLVHGDSDGTVPLEQSIVLDQALTKADVPHQFLIVKNGDHGFRPKPGTTIDPGLGDIQKAVFDFFDKYLKTP